MSTVMIYYENVQKQLGGIVTVVASHWHMLATSLCCGKEPSEEEYDQNAMRPHLLDAINDQKLTPFPCNQGKAQAAQTKH